VSELVSREGSPSPSRPVVEIREPSSIAILNASVIVCTYNRADSLSRTLACLSAQRVSESLKWEVVVVDNNSADNTREVVEAYRARPFPVRYLFEPTQGLSHARNTGVRESTGEILLFTDDDVCPEPDWVQTIVDGMRAEQCDACGGYIAPAWERPPPSWLTERFHGFLAIRADREDSFRLTPDTPPPFGANMAFKRDVFRRFGHFDVTRGRKGSNLASGEDGELFGRLLRNGGRVMFFGNARVHHRIEAFRITKRYFRRWRFQTSRNLGETLGLPGARRIAGIPLYLFPQLLHAVGRAMSARLKEPKDEAFFRELLVWHFLGIMSGVAQGRRWDRAS